MAYTDIDKSDDYFNTVLYTGNGSSGHAITGVGFQPDFVWIKGRTNVATTEHNRWTDVVRGPLQTLTSDETGADTVRSGGVASFDSDGFTVGNDGSFNYSGMSVVAWNWLTDNTSGSSNTDGLITSTVSANTTAGFSIVSYTGTGNSNNTVGHGLTQPLDLLIVKNRDASAGWKVGSTALSGNGYDYSLALQGTSAENANSSPFNNTAPTSSVFTIANFSYADTNVSGQDFVAYCFHSVKGFSKIGSYTGNGSSTNGAFVYTGFKPAWFMIKRTNSTESWYIHDNKRDTFNPSDKHLLANSSNAENPQEDIDLLSNGIKIRSTDSGYNASGSTYIYMAFAENPFVTSTGIPVTAR